MRRPGIEPRSTAWKAAMLTTIPPTLRYVTLNYREIYPFSNEKFKYKSIFTFIVLFIACFTKVSHSKRVVGIFSFTAVSEKPSPSFIVDDICIHA